MLIIIDNPVDGSAAVCFAKPERIIEASEPDQVGAALAALQEALAQGCYVAGFFAYELGYMLEPRLGPLLPGRRAVPLLWFGVFRAPCSPAPAGARAYAGPLHHEWSAEDYAARFAQVKDYISAGDIYQANLSFRSRFAFAGDAFALYSSLRDRAKAPSRHAR
jgi:hypothetical protein